MAIDVYLQIDGIKGESLDDKHKDWIECSSVAWGVLQPRSATASTGGGLLQDEIGLCFSKVKWSYTQQKIGGGSGGNTSGGWDLAANKTA